MKPLLLGAVVLLGQVAAVDALYYWRIVHADSFADSDLVVFGLPILAAFTAQATVVGAWSAGRKWHARAGRLLASVALAALGFSVAMLIALNTWGS